MNYWKMRYETHMKKCNARKKAAARGNYGIPQEQREEENQVVRNMKGGG